MSTESIRRRLEQAGVTDFTPEGYIKRATASGNLATAKRVKEAVEGYEKAVKEFKTHRQGGRHE